MPIWLPIVSKFDPSGVNQADSGLSKLGNSFKGIGIAAGVAAAAATAGLVALSVSSVKAASDFQETSAAVGQIFGPASKSLEDFAKTAPTALGQTQGEFLSAVKTFGIFGQAAGLAADDNAAFSKELAVLATDLASFNNTSVDTAINAIGAGLRGESEPLRQFGVLLDDATLKARAMELGIYTGTGALTQQQRVLAAQAEILAQTSTQQGDFARTSDGMANGLKIMTAQFDNLKLVLGQALYPAVAQLIPVITSFIESLTTSPAFALFVEQLAEVVGFLGETIIKLLPPIMDLIMALLPSLMAIINSLIPVVTAIVEAFLPFINAILPLMVQLINALLPVFLQLVNDVILPLLPVIVQLVEAFMPLVMSIFPLLSRVIEALVPVIFALIDAFLPILLEILPPLLDLFMKLVEPMLQLLEKILPGLPPVIKVLGDGLKVLTDTVLVPLIEGLSAAVDWFTKLLGFDGKSVNVSTGMTTNSDGTPNRDGNPATPFARGGIVSGRIDNAIVGEAGPEAIIPLDRLESMMGTGGGGATVNITVNAGMGADGASIGEQIVTAIRKYERTSGKVFAAA